MIENELLAYSAAFAERPVIIVLNKIDLVDEDTLRDLKALFVAEYPDREIHTISAVSGAGIEAMVHSLQDRIIELKTSLADDEEALAADVDLQERISRDVMSQSMGVAVPLGSAAASTEAGDTTDNSEEEDDDDHDVEVIYTNE